MKKRLVLLVLALVCTGISLWLTQKYVQDNLREKEVVVFRRDVQPFTRITGEMIGLKKVGANGLHPQVATSTREVVGKYASAKAVTGELVLKNKLGKESEVPQGYLYAMQPDERVIAVATDLTRSVGGTVQAGDVVDLIVVLDEKLGGEPQAKTFLQQVRVIDVRDPGARKLSDVNGEGHKEEQGQIINNPGQKQVPGAVVLAVKPYQAEQIALFQKLGEITLTVNPKQSKVFPTSGVRLSQLRQVASVAPK
ncbi:MAG: Flp pilus assembly protein CpaB [Clostridia bacterium]|nr:Flp pilus assembly protein CpaB [Clostridia bacterium]